MVADAIAMPPSADHVGQAKPLRVLSDTNRVGAIYAEAMPQYILRIF
jgi:hypothetical protein